MTGQPSKSYLVEAMGTISFNTIVQADSAEEALLLASEREMVGLSALAESGTSDKYWCGSGEYDCDVDALEIVEVREVDGE